jgi:nitrile hydratase subunit beta
MNGIHDVGGMHIFGPVKPDPDDRPFHHRWEKSVFALMMASTAHRLFTLDEARAAAERMDPVRYLTAPYYEHWLESIERNLIENGVVSGAELKSKLRSLRRNPRKKPPKAKDPTVTERLLSAIRTRFQVSREQTAPPRFAVGDEVVTLNLNPHGHTRLPRYARGRRGVISRVWGTHVFPDTNALRLGENPQPVYSVRFSAQELWGEAAAEPSQAVYLDLWESYLAPAPRL